MLRGEGLPDGRGGNFLAGDDLADFFCENKIDLASGDFFIKLDGGEEAAGLSRG